MIDPIHIYELVSGKWKPSNIQTISDVGRINEFAREHKISLEELKKELKKFELISGNSEMLIYNSIWVTAINKSLEAQNQSGFLDTILTRLDDPQDLYKAKIYRVSGKLIVSFLQRKIDDDYGNMVGLPNTEYWEGVPGLYYASTLFGWDAKSNRHVIDGGSNWYIYGMDALRDEIEEKYGHEIRKDLKENYKAKKVWENL